MLVDLALPQMKPARDPMRSFVYHAADRVVREVFVNGRQVVGEVKVLTFDPAEAACRLDLAHHRMLDEAPRRDCRGCSASEITPLSLTPADQLHRAITLLRVGSWRVADCVYARAQAVWPLSNAVPSKPGQSADGRSANPNAANIR